MLRSATKRSKILSLMGGVLALTALAPGLTASASTPANPVAQPGSLIQAALKSATPGQRAVDRAAQQALAANYETSVKSCMTSKGFPSFGAQNSYQLPKGASPATTSRAYNALNDPSTGCAPTAAKQVFGHLKVAGDIFDRLQTAMYARVARNPEVVTATKKWEACVASMGNFTNPVEMHNSFMYQLVNPKLTVSQASTIKANMDAANRLSRSCEAKVVDPIYVPIEQRAEAAFVHKYAAELANLASALQGK